MIWQKLNSSRKLSSTLKLKFDSCDLEFSPLLENHRQILQVENGFTLIFPQHHVKLHCIFSKVQILFMPHIHLASSISQIGPTVATETAWYRFTDVPGVFLRDPGQCWHKQFPQQQIHTVYHPVPPHCESAVFKSGNSLGHIRSVYLEMRFSWVRLYEALTHSHRQEMEEQL